MTGLSSIGIRYVTRPYHARQTVSPLMGLFSQGWARFVVFQITNESVLHIDEVPGVSHHYAKLVRS